VVSWQSTPPFDNALITPIQGEDPKDPGDKNIPNTRLGRVSCTAKLNSTPIASNITATSKVTVTAGPSPNTTPSLLYEDLQDSNVNLGPDNVWYRPPKSFSAPAIISKADETSLVESQTDKEAPSSDETAQRIATMGREIQQILGKGSWNLVPRAGVPANVRSYSWDSKRKKRQNLLPSKFFFFFF